MGQVLVFWEANFHKSQFALVCIVCKTAYQALSNILLSDIAYILLASACFVPSLEAVTFIMYEDKLVYTIFKQLFLFPMWFLDLGIQGSTWNVLHHK